MRRQAEPIGLGIIGAGNRVALGVPTPAATAREAHRNLMLIKALDLSAKRKEPVALPLSEDDIAAVP